MYQATLEERRDKVRDNEHLQSIPTYICAASMICLRCLLAYLLLPIVNRYLDMYLGRNMSQKSCQARLIALSSTGDDLMQVQIYHS